MEVTVGAFMFMVLLALGFFTIVLSRENIFTRTYSLEVVFDNVKGLREGDNVFLRGVDVGKIKRLRLRPDGVHVIVTLEEELHLRGDYRIEILPSSVLGGRYLNIHEGSEHEPLLAEASIVRGITPVDLIDEATKTTQSIKEALEEGGILENLKATMAQLRDVTTKLNQGEGTLGRLLTEDTVYKDLQQISANLRDVTDRLAAGKGTLGKLMAEDDPLYDNLVEASSSIRKISEDMEGGKGTLGKLMKDDALYQDALLTLNEIRAAVDDLRETTPLATFTSIFFGAF